MQKPSIPQGTRDFPAPILRKRQYLLQTIRSVFETYGFEPLETPAMENLATLTGKYGEEGDKLIFKILNNGLNDPKNQSKLETGVEKLRQGLSSSDLTERALRYDLTIPFARFVAMNHTQLALPYRRYQIQPVWRADRPQKGRYREFTQCDADVVGSHSLIQEAELALIYHEVFTKLGLTGYELRINSRKILAALAEWCGGLERLTDITVAIDKLDKIGLDAVQQELLQRGLTEEQTQRIRQYLEIGGSHGEKLSRLEQLMGDIPSAQQGLDEIKTVLRLAPYVQLVVDFTLARGLNYYTGIIFEAKAPAEVKMGSIGGGGRYDDLTGLFGVSGLTGVGISFGVDRIYDVMEELQLFPDSTNASTKVLFFNLGQAESECAFQVLQQLRQQGISGELYPDAVKLARQFTYAEKKGIPFAAIIGSSEMEEQTVILKDLQSRSEQKLTIPQFIDFFNA